MANTNSSSLCSRLHMGRTRGFWNQAGEMMGLPFASKPRFQFCFTKGLASKNSPVGPIENVEEAVPVGPKHHFPWLALPFDIGQYRHLHGIVVTLVMRHELVIPFQFARVRIQCEHGVGVEIISRTRVAIPAWIRIPGSPKRKVGFRVIGSSDPNGVAPVLIGVASPGIGSRIRGRVRCSPKAPQLFAGFDIVGGNPAIRASSLSAVPRTTMFLMINGATFSWLALVPINKSLVPDGLPVLGIDGDQMSIVGRPETACPLKSPGPSQPARTRSIRRNLVGEGPEGPAGGRIESNYIVPLHRIQDPVHNQRCVFHLVGWDHLRVQPRQVDDG